MQLLVIETNDRISVSYIRLQFGWSNYEITQRISAKHTASVPSDALTELLGH